MISVQILNCPKSDCSGTLSLRRSSISSKYHAAYSVTKPLHEEVERCGWRDRQPESLQFAAHQDLFDCHHAATSEFVEFVDSYFVSRMH